MCRGRLIFIALARIIVVWMLYPELTLLKADATRHEKNLPPVSLVSLSSNDDLRISDNPTLVVNENQPVSLVCQFAKAKGATLREVVWYREFDDGTNVKLLTHDAVMNITQSNDLASKNIRGRGATSLEISNTSPADDGWYQCHVGIYSDRKIVEKVGYIYLNVLVPPSNVNIAVHNSIEGSTLFRHNFSLVCRVEQSKPAASIAFTRNGKVIRETRHANSTLLLDGMAENFADLLRTKDIASDVQASITSGDVERLADEGKSIIRYTILHLKARIGGSKIWESSSYLLWTLYPQYDVGSEYGCLAKHESLEKAKSDVQTLRPPTQGLLKIEIRPQKPSYGSNVILQLNQDLLQNIFPKPILLWSSDSGHMKNKQKFYVGNKLLLRHVQHNQTVFRVQAFNALGTASVTTTLILSDERGSLNRQTENSSSSLVCGKTSHKFLLCFVGVFQLARLTIV